MVQRAFDNLFAPLCVEPNSPFGLAGCFGGRGSEGRNSGNVCRRSVALAPRNVFCRLGMQLQIDRLTPRSLAGAICRAQFGPAEVFVHLAVVRN